MASTNSRMEDDLALSLKKVFRVFAGTLEDTSKQSDARPLDALSEQDHGDAGQAVGYSMRGTAT